MLERYIEKRLIDGVTARGGLCIKLVGYTGIPDRLVLLDGEAVFVECKAPGRKPSPMQSHWLRMLEEKGFSAFVVDSKAAVDELLRGLDGKPCEDGGY